MGGEVWFEVATEAWLEDEERTWRLRRHSLVRFVSDTAQERDGEGELQTLCCTDT